MAFGLAAPSITGQDDSGFSLSPELLAQVRQMIASAPASDAAGGQAPAVQAQPVSNVPNAVAQAIGAAQQRYPDFAQAHPNYLQTTAGIESSFNPDAYNKSGAAGLYQFMPKTAAAFGLSNPYDPTASADAATRLAIANGKTLSGVLNREPSDGELYLAHQQGAGGASKLLSNPGGRAVDTVGYKAVVQNGGSPEMTNQQFANLWINKANGSGPGSTAAPAAFGLAGPTQAGTAGSRLPASGGAMAMPAVDTSASGAAAAPAAPAAPAGGDQGGAGGQKQGQKGGGMNLMQPARPRPFGFFHPMQFAGQRSQQSGQ